MINKDTPILDFQRSFTIKNALFSVAIAWNAVKPITLMRAWRKLWPNVMSADLPSDDEEFTGFNVRSRQQDIAELLQTVQSTHNDNPIKI
jgi:methylmalonyl-CoA mutase N-terminal domain/subunit